MEQPSGALLFSSCDPLLSEGFAWAKAQALSYVHNGSDPAGLWYEAALPGRDAFCIRDVAHQALGAQALGLGAHTKNMLLHFAESISEARDYCMFWEITKENLPCPADYKNDGDFWYNLPANFDMLQACEQEYLWTGDRDYLQHSDFLRFYDLTLNAYLQTWGEAPLWIPVHEKRCGRRGIASYHEQKFSPYLAADVVAAQFSAYRAYAGLLTAQGADAKAYAYEQKAEVLRKHYTGDWFDEKKKRFYGAWRTKKRLYRHYYHEAHYLPVWFGILDNSPLLPHALRNILAHGAANVEAKSYFPLLYWNHGLAQEGYRELCDLCDPMLKRREYPEVSFGVIAAFVRGLMGIRPEADGSIRTLCGRDTHLKLEHLPIRGTHITVTHNGSAQTVLQNEGNTAIRWQACFSGERHKLRINGEIVESTRASDSAGNPLHYATVEIKGGTLAEVVTADIK